MNLPQRKKSTFAPRDECARGTTLIPSCRPSGRS